MFRFNKKPLEHKYIYSFQKKGKEIVQKDRAQGFFTLIIHFMREKVLISRSDYMKKIIVFLTMNSYYRENRYEKGIIF